MQKLIGNVAVYSFTYVFKLISDINNSYTNVWQLSICQS